MHLNFAFLRLVPQNKAIEFINNYHWNEYGLYRTSPFTSSISSFLRIFLAVSPVMLKQRYGSQGCLSVRYVAYACPQTVLRILRKVANHPNSTSD